MSSAKTKNLTPIYAFIQGVYWMNFAAIMGYSGFYLLGSGFSNTEIGIIIAIAGILSAVLQPVLDVPWALFQTDIKEIKISEGITSIGDYAFYNCLNVVEIEIPDSVQKVGICAFFNCSGLSTVTIG